MPHQLPIFSDTLNANQLYKLLVKSSTETDFLLKDSGKATRSAISDPTIVAALIGAGATTLGTLVALIGTIWSTRQKEKQADDDTVIEIKIKKEALQLLLKNNNEARERLENIPKLLHDSGQLLLTPQAATELDHDDNPYHLILSELLPQEVDHIAIIEDQ